MSSGRARGSASSSGASGAEERRFRTPSALQKLRVERELIVGKTAEDHLFQLVSRPRPDRFHGDPGGFLFREMVDSRRDAGKGAADLGVAAADGVQELGRAIRGVDLDKVAESLPFKLPFGKK